MRYHNITSDDMLNGEGIRVVLWVSGCSHNCHNCHNKITHNPNTGLLFDNLAKEEIFNELKKDYIKGLTLSGGDPLYISNRKEVLELVKEVKEKFPNKDIWLYTGYLYEEIKDLEILLYVDVLCDGKFVERLKDINAKYVGSTNQRVIDITRSKKEKQIILKELK